MLNSPAVITYCCSCHHGSKLSIIFLLAVFLCVHSCHIHSHTRLAVMRKGCPWGVPCPAEEQSTCEQNSNAAAEKGHYAGISIPLSYKSTILRFNIMLLWVLASFVCFWLRSGDSSCCLWSLLIFGSCFWPNQFQSGFGDSNLDTRMDKKKNTFFSARVAASSSFLWGTTNITNLMYQQKFCISHSCIFLSFSSQAADTGFWKTALTERNKESEVRQKRTWTSEERWKIGRADFLSPTKATTPWCCYGDLLSFFLSLSYHLSLLPFSQSVFPFMCVCVCWCLWLCLPI